MSDMALPCPLHAVFTTCFVYKGHTHQAPTIWIRNDWKCHINKRERPNTCLTNHKSSISHPIMLLVINNLGGGHTHILTLRTKAISKNQSHAGLWLVCVWFKNRIIMFALNFFHSSRLPCRSLVLSLVENFWEDYEL